MATSQESKAAGLATHKHDLRSIHSEPSNQQLSFEKWLQTRDNSIRPAKEPILKPSSKCSRFEAHNSYPRASSATCTQSHDCTHYDQQHITRDNSSDVLSSSSSNTQQGKKGKSKIPIRIQETTSSTPLSFKARHSILSKQNEAIKHTTQVTDDQEHHTHFDNR
jgi:hypothetical protein